MPTVSAFVPVCSPPAMRVFRVYFVHVCVKAAKVSAVQIAGMRVCYGCVHCFRLPRQTPRQPCNLRDSLKGLPRATSAAAWVLRWSERACQCMKLCKQAFFCEKWLRSANSFCDGHCLVQSIVVVSRVLFGDLSLVCPLLASRRCRHPCRVGGSIVWADVVSGRHPSGLPWTTGCSF